MARKLLVSIAILLVAIIVAEGAFYLYRSRFQKIDYLIAGVPYIGAYNHFFDVPSSPLASMEEVLGYWGDTRFSVLELYKQFPSGKTLSTIDIQDFLRQNGYETDRTLLPLDANGAITTIKQYVNSSKHIPVMVYTKQTTNSKDIVDSMKVVIGVSDSRQTITMHDYSFGNNYAMSYTDFGKTLATDSRALLAVWPSADLAKRLPTPPHAGETYPARLKIMDTHVLFFVSRVEAFQESAMSKEPAKGVKIYQSILADPHFASLPPAYRIIFYEDLASYYLVLKQNDKAIALMKNDALPINKNLDMPDGEWTGQINVFKTASWTGLPAQFYTPYVFLARAYHDKGDATNATTYLNQAFQMHSNDTATVRTKYDALP